VNQVVSCQGDLELTSTYVAVIFQFRSLDCEALDKAVIAFNEYRFGDLIPDFPTDGESFSKRACAARGTIPAKCLLENSKLKL
jgi:hypothetical protein